MVAWEMAGAGVLAKPISGPNDRLRVPDGKPASGEACCGDVDVGLSEGASRGLEGSIAAVAGNAAEEAALLGCDVAESDA